MNAVGFGLEKLPDLNQALSFFGSVWYYPNVKGTSQCRDTYDSDAVTCRLRTTC